MSSEYQIKTAQKWTSIPNSLNPYIVIALIALVACAPTLWFGSSSGGSSSPNLVWSHNFSGQLIVGDLYPRWLIDMNRGAGSPTFYYYGPIPFYILAIPNLLLPFFKPTIQLAIGECLLLALSGLAFFHYARGRATRRTAIFGSALYMLLPYHFEIDLWTREDLGELANYIWLPLVLHYAEVSLESKRGLFGLAISYALLVTSHLPSALLISICLAIALLPRLYGPGFFTAVFRLTTGFVTGLLLAGIYWIPALFTQQFIHTERLWDWYFDFHLWMVPFNMARLYPGVSEMPPFMQRLLFAIATSTAIFLLCSASVTSSARRVELRSLAIPTLLITTAWFLMLPTSTIIWEHTSLWKVQFPWRVAMVVDLAAALSALHALEGFNRSRYLLSYFPAFGTAILLIYSLVSADLFELLDPHTPPEALKERDSYLRQERDVSEYETIWTPSQTDDFSADISGIDKLVYDAARGSVVVQRWRPRNIQLRVNLKETTEVMVRQYYFPNWRASVDGAALSVSPSERNGLLKLPLKSGAYIVSLKMESLPQETLGAALSLMSIAILACIYVSTMYPKIGNDEPRRSLDI